MQESEREFSAEQVPADLIGELGADAVFALSGEAAGFAFGFAFGLESMAGTFAVFGIKPTMVVV